MLRVLDESLLPGLPAHVHAAVELEPPSQVRTYACAVTETYMTMIKIQIA